MNKKGFTLIEVMSVIIIIGLLAMIVLPISMKVIDEVKNNALESQEKIIVKAAKDFIAMYGTDYVELSVTDGTLDITLQDLLAEGLVENNMKNPTTGQNYNYSNYYIEITKLANGNYDYLLNPPR